MRITRRLIVDDDASFRGYVKRFLASEPDIEAIGEAAVASGASGYVVKKSMVEELVPTIRGVF